MIEDLDEALRQLLIRELPVKNGEVNIEFDQPKRDWSSRLSRPTLNLFLYDVRENKTLRQQEWQVERNGNNGATKRRTPVRVDLHYMITAWATEPEDEHRLLGRTLMALFRFGTLPEELLPESLKAQPVPIPIRVAQPEELSKPTDVWGVLENEMRPAIAFLVTLSLNPYHPISGPLVRTRELRFRQTEEVVDPNLMQDRLFMVGGMVKGNGISKDWNLTLVERGLTVPVGEDGEFIIGNLTPGDYTLELASDGHPLTRRKIVVPSSNYDIDLGGGEPQEKSPDSKQKK